MAWKQIEEEHLVLPPLQCNGLNNEMCYNLELKDWKEIKNPHNAQKCPKTEQQILFK